MPPTIEEDDTIVVKGEYAWERPSSPDSMSPGGEPLVDTNALAQDNTSQRLESPEPLADTPSQAKEAPNPQSINNSTPSSNKKQRPNVITTEERLQAMPEKRPLPWRPGVDPGAEIETGGESRRKQIRLGCLLATRGDIVPVPCVSCANGRGKFSVCIALGGTVKGACASCQLSGRPNRCSIKQNDEKDVTQSPNVGTPETSSGNVQQRPSSGYPNSSMAPPAKRRRTNDVPEWESARPQWQQELGMSQARQQQTNDIVIGQHWTTSNPPISTQSMPPASNGHNGIRPLPPGTFGQHSSMGWATVNQPRPTPVPAPAPAPAVTPHPPPQAINGTDSNGSSSWKNLERERREETVGNEEGSGALIDRLPKSKQRQVYGLISGLQGGIEHLQRELDSLKRALGIDEED